jgi:hypothetical protein
LPLPSRLGGLGERRELPQRGPGRSPGRQRFWNILGLQNYAGGTKNVILVTCYCSLITMKTQILSQTVKYGDTVHLV